MEKWYAELSAPDGPLYGQSFAVTGYSLGAHLATAFNLLRQEQATQLGSVNPITATYTFNGAGVGDVLNGRLTEVIAEFHRLRNNVSGNEIVFIDSVAHDFYQRFRGHTYQTAADVDYDVFEIGQQDFNADEKRLLLDALARIRTIVVEAARVSEHPKIRGQDASYSGFSTVLRSFQL